MCFFFPLYFFFMRVEFQSTISFFFLLMSFPHVFFDDEYPNILVISLLKPMLSMLSEMFVEILVSNAFPFFFFFSFFPCTCFPWFFRAWISRQDGERWREMERANKEKITTANPSLLYFYFVAVPRILIPRSSWNCFFLVNEGKNVPAS